MDILEFLSVNPAIAEYLEFCKTNNLIEPVKYVSERHHILPRHMFKQYRHEEWNVVHLSITNHIKAHYLLYHAVPTHGNAASLIRTLGNIDKINLFIDEQELAKLAETVETNKAAYKQFMGSENNPHKGRRRTTQTKRKMSEAQKKVDRSNRPKLVWVNRDEHEECLINVELLPQFIQNGWNRGRCQAYIKKIKERPGRVWTDEQKQKQSEAQKKLGDSHHMKRQIMREYRREQFLINNPSKKVN